MTVLIHVHNSQVLLNGMGVITPISLGLRLCSDVIVTHIDQFVLFVKVVIVSRKMTNGRLTHQRRKWTCFVWSLCSDLVL